MSKFPEIKVEMPDTKDGSLSSCASSEPFALQVLGNSMEPEFPNECVVVIEPNDECRSGAYVMAGRHKEAIPILEAARDAEPLNAMIWINLGAAYLGNPVLATSEQQMQAITAFEKALELNPAATNVHSNLGLIFVDRKESDLAVAAFRRAVQVNPLDNDARHWLRRLEGGQRPGEKNE